MSLQERIQQSVETALADLRARVEEDVRSIVEQLITAASEERTQAVDDARRLAFEEAARETDRKVAETEARVRASVDELIENARSTERDLAAADVRKIIEAEADQKLQSALASSREEMRLALANAENRANEAIRESVTAARVRERESEMAGVSRLLESVRGLDGAASLSEVLDALGLAAGREASRAAVLVLRNDRLLGWKLAGFGPRDSQPKSIDLSLAEAGIAGLAVGGARSMTTRDPQSAAEGPGFAHLPNDRMGFAVPVTVGGRVVAVLYADGVAHDGREHVVPSSWPEVIEILARHAARCLEALTVQKAATQTPSPRFWVPPGPKTPAPQSSEGKAADSSATPGEPDGHTTVARTRQSGPVQASLSASGDNDRPQGIEESARRLARLLLSEIRLYHEPAVDEGRRSGNLLSRLGPEIERARRLYDESVPASLRTRAELFHQELVATLAGGDPALLGMQA
jgi:hypothetical protein